jgi:hypothetical protein
VVLGRDRTVGGCDEGVLGRGGTTAVPLSRRSSRVDGALRGRVLSRWLDADVPGSTGAGLVVVMVCAGGGVPVVVRTATVVVRGAVDAEVAVGGAIGSPGTLAGHTS